MLYYTIFTILYYIGCAGACTPGRSGRSAPWGENKTRWSKEICLIRGVTFEGVYEIQCCLVETIVIQAGVEGEHLSVMCQFKCSQITIAIDNIS